MGSQSCYMVSTQVYYVLSTTFESGIDEFVPHGALNVAMSFRVSAGVIEQVLSKTQRQGNNNTFLLYSRLSLCFPYWPDNNLKQRRCLLQKEC